MRVLGRPLRRGEQVPLLGDSHQDVGAAVGEANPGPGDKVLDSARDQHLAWARPGSDTCTDVDSDPSDLVTS